MSYQATVYRILIASPSDVVAERKAIAEVIYSWNAVNSAEFGVVLLPVMWETHSTPELGNRPQAIINKQIVQACDLLVGAFWTRIGTHTGIAESGTVEEIEKFREAGKPVMLYFSSAPVVPDSVDPEQYKRLTSFKKKCQDEGLVYKFSSMAELREKLNEHLTRAIRDIHRTGGALPAEGRETGQGSKDSVQVIKEQVATVLLRYGAEWAAERDSKPDYTVEGKRILKKLGSELLEFRTMLIGKVDDSVIEKIDEQIKETRVLQKAERYTAVPLGDTFWFDGDMLFSRLADLLDEIP